MVQRCTNPEAAGWARYGGAGVRVCRRWRDSFEAFAEDLGGRPTRLHSIGRVWSDGHYSCGTCAECRVEGWSGNVRWSLRAELADGQPNRVRLTHRGRTLTILEWARETGLPARTIYNRLRIRQYTPERALTQPPKKHAGDPDHYHLDRIWRGLQRRCYYPADRSFADYGGRGIGVCRRWRESSQAFKSDVGERPAPKLSFHRIDSTGGYWCGRADCPECGPLGRAPNCRWASHEDEKAKRRKRNKRAAPAI